MPADIRDAIFDYWGWRVRLTADSAESFEAMLGVLPERPAASLEVNVDCTFTLEHSDRFYLRRNGEKLYSDVRMEGPLRRLELAIHEQMPLYASGAVFVHAGAVGWQGRALLLPGSSYTGKSTLTHALIRLGAEYYSDEYAVIQNNGELVPYRRRLTLRGESGAESRLAIDSALSPDHESTIRLVAFCPYVQGSRWQPAESSPGQGVLGLFSHTVTAQLSPNRDLNWLRLGSQHARFLKSERGEAEIVAVELLKLLEQQP